MRKPRKKATGAKRMREQGYKLVQIWLSPTEARAIIDAADQQHSPVATWVRNEAYRKATEMLPDLPKYRMGYSHDSQPVAMYGRRSKGG